MKKQITTMSGLKMAKLPDDFNLEDYINERYGKNDIDEIMDDDNEDEDDILIKIPPAFDELIDYNVFLEYKALEKQITHEDVIQHIKKS